MLKPIRYLVLYVVIVGLLTVVAKYASNDTQSVQAAPAEQISIQSDRTAQIKSVDKGATVGNCDLYLVTIDIPLAPDSVQIVTICGEDREAR